MDKKLQPQLEEIVKFLKDLKAKGNIGFFDWDTHRYHGQFLQDFSIGSHTIGRTIDLKAGTTSAVKSEWKYFTGYVGPTKSLNDMRSQKEFLRYLKKNIPTRLKPSSEMPKTQEESQRSDAFHDGIGTIHFSKPRISVMYYGNLTYELDLGEEEEKNFTERNGKKRS